MSEIGTPADSSLLLDDVFEYVEAHRDGFVQRFLEYLRLPSISAHGAGMDQVVAYIGNEMSSMGLEVQLVPTPGGPMVLGRSGHVTDAPTVLLYGHYDVQPPEPLEAWTTPPFEPDIRDGRVYARGAGDNKGQHLAQLLALESLLACRNALPCNVIVLLEGGEEIGSPHLADFAREYKDELAADLVIISDGPVHESGRPEIVYGVRGSLFFELHARGANRDLHSGNWGGIAPNPLWTLVHLLSTMKNTRGEVTVAGFYDAVLPLSPLEQAALADMPFDRAQIERSLGVAALDQPLERGVGERLTAWPTLTINGLHGGYGGPGPKTVLPHEAIAKCDIRMVAAQTADEVFPKIVAHVQRHAPDVEVVLQGSMDPSKTPLDSPYTPLLRRAIAAAQHQDPYLLPTLGGSLPNYVFTGILGQPTFLVPYANADQGNHGPNENLELDRFIQGIKTGAAMLVSIAEGHQAGGA